MSDEGANQKALSDEGANLAGILAGILAGRVAPADRLRRCRERLADPIAASSFVTVFDDATPPGESGPLAGVVCAVKQLIDLDAPVVLRMRRAGVTLIGTTRSDEIGLGTFSPGVVNPWDGARTAGGSSGGSAVAVARGAADIALATDTAGSARIPAACAAVAGLCLGREWESREGVTGLSPMFDRLGLIAATGADLELLWRLTGGGDAPDGPPPRVHVLTADALGRVDGAWADAARRAAAHLCAAWGRGPVEELRTPRFSAFGPPRAVVVISDAARSRPGYQASTELVRRQLASAADDAARTEAASQLRRLGRHLSTALADDVLVLPTLPGPPPRWDELITVENQLEALGRMTRLCAPVNSSGLVAASVPYGFDESGLPIGVQVVAATEQAVVRAAAELSPAGRVLPSALQ